MAHKKHPVIIIGGGPAGAAAALYLLRKGITPVIVERDAHPRFHVGESLTGATALALKALGLGPRIEAQNYPIKHGAVFYGPDGKNEFWIQLLRRNEETNRFLTKLGTSCGALWRRSFSVPQSNGVRSG